MPNSRQLITIWQVILTCPIYSREKIWWVEPGDNQILLKYSLQVCSCLVKPTMEMMVTMVTVVVVAMGVIGGGMVPTTACFINQKEDAMFAAIWLKHQPSILHISSVNLPYMVIIYISLPPRKVN